MLASFTNYSFSNLKKVEKNNPPQLKNHDILIKNFAPFGKTQDKHSSPVLKDIKNSEQINKKIKIVYKSKPFYFRFSPELRDIKSKKIIIAKIDYDHPNLGRCTYEIVKDLKESKFFGWCNTKKIKRIETIQINIVKKNIAKCNEISPDARGFFLIFSGCIRSFRISLISLTI